MNYRIVGADGKTYGPVGLEHLRQWLAEGRIEARTPVHVEGTPAWTVLSALPELSGAFAAVPPTVSAFPPAAPMARGTNGFATAGLICSLLSWVCCCCLPLSLLGLIFSIIALVQINSQPNPQEGKVFAILGLVISAANLLFGGALGLLNILMNPGTVHWSTQF